MVVKLLDNSEAIWFFQLDSDEKSVVIFEEFFEQTTFASDGFGTPDYLNKILVDWLRFQFWKLPNRVLFTKGHNKLSILDLVQTRL